METHPRTNINSYHDPIVIVGIKKMPKQAKSEKNIEIEQIGDHTAQTVVKGLMGVSNKISH